MWESGRGDLNPLAAEMEQHEIYIDWTLPVQGQRRSHVTRI